MRFRRYLPALLIVVAVLAIWAGVRLRDAFQRLRERKTVARMATDAAALELRFRARHTYPLSGFIGTARSLESEKLGWFCGSDGWKRPMFYSCSADGQHYVLVSFGADGMADARVMGKWKAGLSPADDIVFADGRVLQWPQGYAGWYETWRDDMSDETLRRYITTADRVGCK